MAEPQLRRLLQLMTLVRARAGRNATELAGELGVTKRTVFRDLQTLASAGVRCICDKDAGGYVITGDLFLPPLQLNLGEAMALSVLASELAHGRSKLPFLDDAWRAVTKVRSQLPPAVRDDVAELGEHVRVDGARVSPQDGCDGQFQLIRQAIADKRKVRCVYAGGKSAGEPFDFGPYTLYFGQRAWYAIGMHASRGEVRSLKLNRFKSIKPTKTPYGIPDGWTVEKYFGKAWRMIPGKGSYKVAIRFDEKFGANVADTLWHATQTVESQPDGSMLFRCEVSGLDEIVWWILGYGPHAEVIEPAALRMEISNIAKRISQIYAADRSG